MHPPPAGSIDNGPVVVGALSWRVLVLVVAAICAVAAIIVALSEWSDRERRLNVARHQAETLARVLDEQTTAMVRGTDLALLAIAESLRRDTSLRQHDPDFEDTLRRLLENLPAVRALFVVGPDGFIMQDSDRHTPRASLADRDYFDAHRTAPDRGLFVGQPLVSRSVGTWFMGMSRRVQTAQGEFAGVVAAALEVRYFELLYEELGLGPDDVIALVRRDGTLVARQPRADDRIGKPLMSGNGQSVLENALARARAGSFEVTSAIDGTSRIFGYRAREDHPLVVIVGLSREQVLMPWRTSAATASVAMAAAFMLASLLLWVAMRHARREAAVQTRVIEAARLEALGRLTSGVAHDFNNLLQSMSAALRLLGKFTRDDPRAAEVIQQGLASMERGRNLVGQLLDVARPQALQMRDLDVNALLAEMTTLLKNAAQPSARIELDLAPDIQPCRADPSRLEAAVLNLVVNARDALGPRNGSIQVSTQTCVEAIVAHDGHKLEPGKFVCVTVRDNGVGMPAEVRRRAMEPFFTTKGERGTGLGLAQVYTFMREIGGDMKIESEPGVGTAVHLYLPRQEPAAAPAPSPEHGISPAA
jgi:signal transduction histidine kinase